MNALVVYYWVSSTDSGIDSRYFQFDHDKPTKDEIRNFLNYEKANHSRYLSIDIVNIIPCW